MCAAQRDTCADAKRPKTAPPHLSAASVEAGSGLLSSWLRGARPNRPGQSPCVPCSRKRRDRLSINAQPPILRFHFLHLHDGWRAQAAEATAPSIEVAKRDLRCATDFLDWAVDEPRASHLIALTSVDLSTRVRSCAVGRPQEWPPMDIDPSHRIAELLTTTGFAGSRSHQFLACHIRSAARTIRIATFQYRADSKANLPVHHPLRHRLLYRLSVPETGNFATCRTDPAEVTLPCASLNTIWSWPRSVP